MNLRARGSCRAIFGTLGLAVAVTGAGSGCGGGGSGGGNKNNNYPDSSVHFDSSTGGNNADTGTRTIPPVGDGVTTLASGAAFLVGLGDNSCTNQDPPSGDRWCAFTMPSSSFLGGNDLWVIDVTKAAAGTAIRCDVSDLNCLLLTSTLYTGDLTIHGFFGDTLIYYADVGQTSASAYGWRPGMTSARRLSTNAPPNGCLGHPTTDAVRCLQNQDNTTVSGQTTFDLTAGYLTVGGNTPLPKVATIIAQLSTDPASTTVTQPPRFRTSFSSDGVWLAWSARPTAGDTETLMVQKIGDASTRVTVASDASQWTFSRDGKTLYWLKSFNYDPTAPLGTLQSTPFPVPPTGTAPTVTTIQPNVSFFNPAGDTGLILLGASTNGAAQLSVMADSAQPSQAKVLDNGVTQLIGLSLDGHDILYEKTGLDLYANGIDLSTACTLTTTAAGAPFGTFSDPPSLVFWAKPDATVQNYDGMYTNLSNCQSQQFTNGFIVWNPVKDQGLVYGDDAVFDTLGNADVTLRYSSLTNGVPPASGTAIQQRANPMFGLLLPYLSAVVYTVNVGGDTDGIYLKGDLPFPATTPPAPPLQHPDAGVGPTTDGGADAGADASDGG